MNTQKLNYVGIDVSKNTLEVFLHSWPKSRTFPNQPKGHQELIAIFKNNETPSHIILEPTAGYEAPLVSSLHKNAIRLSLVNPIQARSFATACKRIAKTDAIDAQCLSDYGAALKPQAALAQSTLACQLKATSRRREALVAQRTEELTRLELESDSFVRADIKSMLRVLEGRIKKCDQQIDSLIESNEETKTRKIRMCQIKGVGQILSNTLIAEMPELGHLSDKQITALAGLAPYNRDSGKWKGKRFVQGGRSRVRKALYMPTVTAIIHNPILKAFYNRLKEEGKAPKVALTATMRKLLCVLNKLLADPKFQPS